MRQNWVMKLLVACNAAAAFCFSYSAYHFATFSFGFPGSPVLNWSYRFLEVFPNLGIVTRMVYEVTGRPLMGSVMDNGRLPVVLLHVALAIGAAALACGLACYAKWARTITVITAALAVLLHLKHLVPIALHLFLGRSENYVGQMIAATLGPQYTCLGLFASVSITWLMWIWRKEPRGSIGDTAVLMKQCDPDAVFNAWTEAKELKLKKWLWAIRIALLLHGILTLLSVLPFASRWHLLLGQPMLFLVLRLIPIPAIWLLLSRQDRWLGVGLTMGFGAAQLLPFFGLVDAGPDAFYFLLLMGLASWTGVLHLLTQLLPPVAVLVCGIVTTLLMGRATPQSAGKWSVGVLLPLFAAIILFQISHDRSIPKTPERTTEQTLNQSAEHERGFKAQMAVRNIAKCLFQFAAAHPQKGFPDNLQQLGPGGNNCLQDARGIPEIPGYVFLYEPSTSAPGGSADRFILKGRQVEHIQGTFSHGGGMMDETGVFAWLDGDKRGFSLDWERGLLNGIGNCLKREFDAKGDGSYPENLHGLLSIKGEYGTPCLPAYLSDDLSIVQLWRNKFTYRDYDFSYQATNKTGGKYKSFHLEARPKEYGKQSLRSYLIDETGKPHATPYDRPANLSDPDANCEPSKQNCSTLPALDAPK